LPKQLLYLKGMVVKGYIKAMITFDFIWLSIIKKYTNFSVA